MPLARFQLAPITHRDQVAHAAYRAAATAVAELAAARRASQARRQRGHQAARTRGVALYLANVTFDVPARALARVAGLSERQVRRALNAIEDARDHRAIDEALDRLQGRLLA